MKRYVFAGVVFLATSLLAQEPCIDDQICQVPSYEETQELFSQINGQNRRLYRSMNCWGKRRAIELAPNYRNKNCAVQQAAREMGKRQKKRVLNNDGYTETIYRESGQGPFRRRWGY